MAKSVSIILRCRAAQMEHQLCGRRHLSALHKAGCVKGSPFEQVDRAATHGADLTSVGPQPLTNLWHWGPCWRANKHRKTDHTLFKSSAVVEVLPATVALITAGDLWQSQQDSVCLCKRAEGHVFTCDWCSTRATHAEESPTRSTQLRVSSGEFRCEAAVQRVCVWASVTSGAQQVPLLCSWVVLMRYQTQTSIHQPHWWGQWGATASVKGAIMVPRAETGGPFFFSFTKVIEHRGLETLHQTNHHFALLY